MKTAVTIGNFDGVHLGHQALIELTLIWQRKQLELGNLVRSCALTFEPHPREVLTGVKIPRLCTPEQKVELLKHFGLSDVIQVKFTEAIAELSAREFFEDYLVNKLQAKLIVVGENFYFGHKREGSPEKLAKWCKEQSIELQIVPALYVSNEVVSSSKIRDRISDGNLPQANKLLGRSYSITSRVIKGDQKGKTIGFPTANFPQHLHNNLDLCVPATGVYKTTTKLIESGQCYNSITNIGHKPTTGANRPLSIETHLLDFSSDLYGKLMTVEFSHRIRGEIRFESLEQLRLQIQRDIDFVRSKNR